MWTVGDEEIDIDTDAVTVEYGRHPVGNPKELHYRSDMYRRADRPVVNGVDLVGATVIHTKVMREQRLTGRYVNVRRPIDEHFSDRAPEATTGRTAAVVHALVTHWLTRDPHALVHRITAAAFQVGEQRFSDSRDREAAEKEIERQRAVLARLDEREADRAVYLTAPPPILPEPAPLVI